MAGMEIPLANLSNASSKTDSASSSIRSEEAKVQISRNAPSWRSYVWDTLDKPPEERRFLAKLDFVLLTFGALGEFAEALEQMNINNAFVSGMKEDLSLYGNELNYMTTAWTVGYVLGQIPSNMILTRMRPRIWIPTCQVLWSVLTVALAKSTAVHQIYILRFCIGLFESSYYPGMQYIIGSWYRKDELAKRSSIFPMGYTLGTIFVGFLMAAIWRLDGIAGYRAWQWLFIINTAIALPVAVAGFFVLPDVPEISRAWFLTPGEIALARRRMALEGRADRGPYTRAKAWRIASSWHIYLLSLAYVLYINGCSFGSQPAFSLWLKSKGYGVAAVNVYPTLTSLPTLVVTVVCAWASDTVLGGERWPPIVFSGLVNVVVSAGMAAWSIPDAWKWASFFLIGLTPGISGMFFAWAHEICSDDNEERALVTATMNKMAYIMQAWLPLVIWQQVDAPRYPRGYITMVFFGLALVVVALLTRTLDRRDRAHRRRRTTCTTTTTTTTMTTDATAPAAAGVSVMGVGVGVPDGALEEGRGFGVVLSQVS